MSRENFTPNGIAILDRPLSLEGKTIYGILYEKEEENVYESLSEYIAYLVAAEQFFKNNGKISDDRTKWILPKVTATFNEGLREFIVALMKDLVGHKIVEFDKPIEPIAGEVDDDRCLITDKTLIDRYSKEQTAKEQSCQSL